MVPSGVASEPSTGAVYVADLQNHRINQFSIWGGFVKAWGWGVRTGAPELQTCTAQTGCLKGLPGSGKGQLGLAPAITVDGAGDVYIVDRSNQRVQKFDPGAGSGDPAQFLLMFGGGVNETKSSNLCTAASGDVCRAGTSGSDPGEFGNWAPFSNMIAVGPNDDVYVGDENRIQRFDSEGDYIESIGTATLAGERVQSLAIDNSGGVNNGNLYVSRCSVGACTEAPNIPGSKPGVLRMSPAGTVLATLSVPDPQALSVDADGNLYATDGSKVPGTLNMRIHKFTPTGAVMPEFPFSDGFDSSVGIATSSACEIPGVDFYVSNFSDADGYVRAYGPPPNPTICPPPSVPPEINAQFPLAAGTTSAELVADINPNFWPDATYRVEYGTDNCSTGGCTQTTPERPLTTEVTSEDVRTEAVGLGNLAPGTTYHFRFIAQSSGGGPVRGVGGTEALDGAEGTFTTFTEPLITRPCPNESLRAQANPNPATGLSFSQSLAGCRGYELVSPPDKNGGDISDGEIANSFTSPRKSSPDGERTTYSSLRPFADPASAPLVNQYISTRNAGGWSAQPISPPRSTAVLWPPPFTGQFKAFDDGVCEGWFVQDNELTLAPGAPAGVASIYKRDYCDPAAGYELLTPIDPPGFGTDPGEIKVEFYVPTPQGSSADGAHTVFRVAAELTGNACPTAGINQVYITTEKAPFLRLISALPPGKGGQGTCTNSSAGTLEDSTGGFRESSLVGAVSEDASKVFWTDSRNPLLATEGMVGTVDPGDLYLRVNATQAPSPITGGVCTDPAKACTVPIATNDNAVFWGADPAGTKAIYSTKKFAEDNEEELFEYDVASASSQLIAKGFKGVAGFSEDISRIYFVSTAVLTGTQQNSEGEQALAKAQNLYLRKAGGGFVFVARIRGGEDLLAALKPSTRSSRVSPDGLHLAFTSVARLTDYNNTDALSGMLDSEVYLYDAASGPAGELSCIGCNPSGARPQGRLSLGIGIASTLPGWPEQLHPSRLLSADGDRLLFNSVDTLVPRDHNTVSDVYMWQRAAGQAECQTLGAEYFVAAAGGCISLISDGVGSQGAEVIDSSTDGRDIFFTTGVSLLPQDPAQIDLYDARVGGGFPQPIPSDPCEVDADSCRPATQAPSPPVPGSNTPRSGNPVPKPPKCPKGKHRVTKKGKSKCVPNKKKAKKGKQTGKNGRAGR
ncbi:MAG TPA: hypothetical protein VEW07_07870 [Solirubrobacterales bacterium]|nr:hypothetical protein [Solirubrobacterales bacterium]